MLNTIRPGVYLKIIHRQVHSFASFERLNVLDQQFRFKGIGMIVVDLQAFFERFAALVPVVSVMRQERDSVFTNSIQNAVSHGGLSGARTASNTNNQGSG